MYTKTLIGAFLPFAGTAIGAFFVFFIKNGINKIFKQIISGFAAGVMIAASVWSLLIPAMEYQSSLLLGSFAFLPATLGLWCGIFFLILVNKITQKIDETAILSKRRRSFGDNTMLFWAVTLHNLPEGMAVGVAYAAMLAFPSGETYGGALALSLGIAIQNIPEGAIISMPLHADGAKKSRAFLYSVLSGIIEPIGAFLTLLAISVILPLLPFLLGFAAGAMIYAVVSELAPTLCLGEQKNMGALSFGAGFSIMMALDILLG